MFATRLATKLAAASFLLMPLVVAACGGDPDPTEPLVELDPAYAGPGPGTEGEAEVVEILDQAIAAEITAYYTYRYAAAEFGTPFAHIRDAELRHVQAVQGLYTKRGLEAPGLAEPSGVPTFATRTLACESGAAMERSVVTFYEGLLPLVPPDVARVFEQLQSVSEEKHLPAFLGCS